jgi:hypothetical protein
MNPSEAWSFPLNMPLSPSEVMHSPYGNTYDAVAKLENITESDPSGRALSEPGTKADAGKDLPWLFQTGFANALEEVVKVTTLGARKYTPNGWASVDNGIERYMEGFGRHMQKLSKSETFDNGPGGIGTYHKAQMIWNLLASLELEIRAAK